MDNKTGKRIGVYISEELLDQCDAAVEKSGADSRSEFICDAIMHYIAVINMKENSRVLTPALESVIGSKIALTEDRINQMLFKVAVELAVQNHLTAGRYRYEDDYLDGLRDYCVQQVKALNGRVDLKEIQKAYEG
ncbi:MAG: ribbon-helix-helix protein, CopG family [Oscillospiraceae bacterium]|nr:ribbon-helix-helix protein, CopG family [Oscillospiraceae bacterium]